ncbi:hypothetical protein RM717_34885 [Streptomyces griseus]|uniref:Uncharacterized protein n=1 Tax=Streptomyces stephensoniae TaxID=3375367 RepID=A0ABU2WCQ5_9ACTN|nr:hypothetical protein [Streptomyces griseus]MDT0495678.1 hypothetical protein [Streptomyces griseus]
MSTTQLPDDVREFLEFIGNYVKSYGYMKHNEEAKIKADMMNVPLRWSTSRISPEVLRKQCEAVGMTESESAKVADWLKRRQANRRLRPSHYRDFKWNGGRVY